MDHQVLHHEKATIMRIAGLILIVLGILSLLIRSFTFFATETVVGPAGLFAWDVSRPHTIFINPLAGVLAVVAGIVLLAMTKRQVIA
jgi:drug/metabolite transporter (DMT)-like permease